jgi:hypothetical protein
MAPSANMAVVKPTTLSVETFKLDDLSTADDSGHRELESDRVGQLYQMITAGQWGQTTLGRPSVRCLA